MFKQEKVSKAIQKEVANIILKEFDFEGMVTVTRVECSSNMFFAKVFISSIDNEENTIKILNKKVRSVQAILNKKFKIRPVPRIEFVKEGMTESAARIEKILGDIEKKEKKC
jgi:ribosome-binding factor A